MKSTAVAAIVVAMLAGAFPQAAGAADRGLRPVLDGHPLHGGATYSRGRPRRGHRVLPRLRTAIVGGLPAAQGSWSFMAFIEYYDANNNPVFACSGTVISVNVVLTAGHCAIDETTGVPFAASGYVVVTGSVDRTAGQASRVLQVVAYPGYDPSTLDRDAALLILSTPTTAPPISLDSGSDPSLTSPGTPAAIAGWGETYYGDPFQQYQLEWASTVVQSTQWCGQQPQYYDSSTQLCTLDYPSDTTGTCFGDSGGPLVVMDSTNNPVEIGVTSSGPPICATILPDIFTRTDQLHSWAHSWISTVAPPSPPPPPPPPPPQLPRMTRSDVTSFTRQTLTGVFGRRFSRGHQYQAQCSRLSNTRFTCGVSWSSGPTDYWGTVTLYYQFNSSQVYWYARYRISAVNDRCYQRNRSRNWRRLCKIQVFHVP